MKRLYDEQLRAKEEYIRHLKNEIQQQKQRTEEVRVGMQIYFKFSLK
jgi:hypothetical protein